MPDQKEGVMLGIITPQGPVVLCLTREAFSDLIQELITIEQSMSPTTIIPKAFENAFKEGKEC